MATVSLLCRQCNFENEPERVYCHNCGAKLDRTLLPPEATRREDPVVVQERVRKMVNPRRGMGFLWVKRMFASLAIAAVVAAVLVLIKAPADLPHLSSDAVMGAPTITDDVASLEEMAGPRAMRYSEDNVNAFLQNSIRGKETTTYGVSMKFERAFVHFHSGYFSITSEESIMGVPIYATTIRTVEIQRGAIVSHVLGGSFGRLPIPAKAMPYLEGIFAPLWRVLEHDRTQVARLQAVTFLDKTVVLTTPAAVR